MKQRFQPTPPLRNDKPAEPPKTGGKGPVPLTDAALRHVAGGNSLPVKGW
jgi:hypothetical protein